MHQLCVTCRRTASTDYAFSSACRTLPPRFYPVAALGAGCASSISASTFRHSTAASRISWRTWSWPRRRSGWTYPRSCITRRMRRSTSLGNTGMVRRFIGYLRMVRSPTHRSARRSHGPCDVRSPPNAPTFSMFTCPIRRRSGCWACRRPGACPGWCTGTPMWSGRAWRRSCGVSIPSTGRSSRRCCGVRMRSSRPRRTISLPARRLRLGETRLRSYRSGCPWSASRRTLNRCHGSTRVG